MDGVGALIISIILFSRTTLDLTSIIPTHQMLVASLADHDPPVVSYRAGSQVVCLERLSSPFVMFGHWQVEFISINCPSPVDVVLTSDRPPNVLRGEGVETLRHYYRCRCRYCEGK